MQSNSLKDTTDNHQLAKLLTNLHSSVKDSPSTPNTQQTRTTCYQPATLPHRSRHKVASQLHS
ncbi:hypothetical protein A2U01_0063373 [Trifolium medium]|uniref:Uncharacterized protein n=1 Tax=Trifolium medium TaxID=97028 RepID=A0A392S171_9FABA|nr:hypothetical protein [Trifolium medium]